jgi:hypothetical protein
MIRLRGRTEIRMKLRCSLFLVPNERVKEWVRVGCLWKLYGLWACRVQHSGAPRRRIGAPEVAVGCCRSNKCSWPESHLLPSRSNFLQLIFGITLHHVGPNHSSRIGSANQKTSTNCCRRAKRYDSYPVTEIPIHKRRVLWCTQSQLKPVLSL